MPPGGELDGKLAGDVGACLQSMRPNTFLYHTFDTARLQKTSLGLVQAKMQKCKIANAVTSFWVDPLSGALEQTGCGYK
jgi:hypothetical protein